MPREDQDHPISESKQRMSGGDKREEMQEKGANNTNAPEVKKPGHRVSMNMLLMIFHAIKLAHTNRPALNRTILVFLLATIVNEVIGWHFGQFAGKLHEILKDGVGPHIDPAMRIFFAQFFLGLVFVGGVQ
jgi:hypothetical protein